jgi:hypothetical protein
MEINVQKRIVRESLEFVKSNLGLVVDRVDKQPDILDLNDFSEYDTNLINNCVTELFFHLKRIMDDKQQRGEPVPNAVMDKINLISEYSLVRYFHEQSKAKREKHNGDDK